VETLKDFLFIVGGIVGLATGILALWARFADKRKQAQSADEPDEPKQKRTRPRSPYPVAIPVEPIPEVIPVEPVDEPEYDDRPRISAKKRARAREMVKGPAIAVMIAGALGSLANLLILMGGFISTADRGAETSDVVMILMFIGCTAASGLAIWAGYNMLHLRNYALSMVGSFAIMPGACLCLLSGVGIGIWSVIVLHNPDVKAAFR